MAGPTPTQSFAGVSASPVQKIDINDGPAVARALLQSEAYAFSYNRIRMDLNLVDPPILLQHSSGAGLAMIGDAVKEDRGILQTAVMAKLGAQINILEKLTGAHEDNFAWGSVRGTEAGVLKVKRGTTESKVFDAQAQAVEKLRTSLRDTVIVPNIGPQGVDIYTASVVSGTEAGVRDNVAQGFTRAVEQYQKDIAAAGKSSGKTPTGIEYHTPDYATADSGNTLNAQASRVTQALVAALDSMPAVAAPAALKRTSSSFKPGD